MVSQITLAAFAILVISGIQQVHGHGRLLDPVGRSSRWRVDRSAQANYDDNGANCGGLWKHYSANKGRCGLCGDDYSISPPRPSELGGKYGQGNIVKSYKSGSIITVQVDLTANHKGKFTFELCNLDGAQETETCYQNNLLKLSDGLYSYPITTSRSGTYDLQVRLPAGLKCSHCALRWTYIAGNGWGVCENGQAALGCGNQETFKSCADIKIT